MGKERAKSSNKIINNIKQKIISIIKSLCKNKTKALPEGLEETKDEYQKIKEELETLKKDYEFETLKNIYDKYAITTNNRGKTVAVEKTTGYIEEEPEFVTKVKFAIAWKKSASGNYNEDKEELAYERSFNEGAKETYEKMREIITKQLKKTGNINTKEVLEIIKKMEYKWARMTSRKLFKNEFQAEILTEYFRNATQKPKKQKEKTLTTDQALYGK